MDIQSLFASQKQDALPVEIPPMKTQPATKKMETLNASTAVKNTFPRTSSVDVLKLNKRS